MLRSILATGERRRTALTRAAALVAAACAVAAAGLEAGASSLHFEIANPNGANQFAGYNYLCPDCTVEQYEAMVLPAGYAKRNVRILLPSTSGGFPATPPAGVAQSLDFVPDLPGDDFFFCCEILDGAFLGADPVSGLFFTTAEVMRTNVFSYAAGSVVHDIIDTLGNRYILFLIDQAFAETVDVDQLGALAGLALPAGWTYESRVLGAPLEVSGEGGLTHNFGHVALGSGVMTSFQRYSLPEPAPALLGGIALLVLGARLGRRP